MRSFQLLLLLFVVVLIPNWIYCNTNRYFKNLVIRGGGNIQTKDNKQNVPNIKTEKSTNGKSTRKNDCERVPSNETKSTFSNVIDDVVEYMKLQYYLD